MPSSGSSSSSSSSPPSDRTIRATAPISINSNNNNKGGSSSVHSSQQRKPSNSSSFSSTLSSSPSSPPTISYARPPTPTPLRPAAPLALRTHPKLPHMGQSSSSYPPTRSLVRPTKFHRRTESASAAATTPPAIVHPPTSSSFATISKAAPTTIIVAAAAPTTTTTVTSSLAPPLSSLGKKSARPAPLRLVHSHSRSRSDGNAKPCLDYATRALPPVPCSSSLPSAAADPTFSSAVVDTSSSSPSTAPNSNHTTTAPLPPLESPLPPPVPRKSWYDLLPYPHSHHQRRQAQTSVADSSRWFDSELELVFSRDEIVLHTPLMDASSLEGSPRATRIRRMRREDEEVGGGFPMDVSLSESGGTPDGPSEVPTEVPNTPCSAQFSTESMESGCSSATTTTAPATTATTTTIGPLRMDATSRMEEQGVQGLVGTKSLRWDEIAVYPEQQGLVNVHGLLRKVLDASLTKVMINSEVIDLCKSLMRHLPQPGVPSERKYTLKVQYEEQLERALRMLDGSLSKESESKPVERALELLRQLVPAIQLRFATLPHHRDVQRLKAERAQLKEERALVLVQLAIQEAEIKTAQLRREAERVRELEEAAKRRLKRKEEKRKEKEVYLGYRRLLEERSEQLKEINARIEKENEALMRVREEREKQKKQKEVEGKGMEGAATAVERGGLVRDDAVLKRRREKAVFGGSVRIASVRDGIKCW
ncbi:hypothetical protein FRC17_006230, partial [Serendipita sp. 399]